MRVLVVAHPDDEILWFNPEEFERIVICFLGYPNNPTITEGRRSALAEHPLKDRIRCLEVEESNYWRDKGEYSNLTHIAGRSGIILTLSRLSKEEGWSDVTTHSATGEYGHSDHKLVHDACMSALDCTVNGKDPETYRNIRALYQRHGCWTWDT